MSKNKRMITVRARRDIDALGREFELLSKIQAKLPAGESAYRTLSRVKGEWRLPRDTIDASQSERLAMLPVRDDNYKANAYLAVVPQPIIMHKEVSKLLEEYAMKLFAHYPEENSLARREHGVPMLLGRFDVIVDLAGNIQICEMDDVCSLWPAMAQINPITESYLRVFETQLGKPLYTAELFQYSDWPLDASPRVRKEFAHVWIFEDDGSKKPVFIPRADSFRMAICEKNGLQWRTSRSADERDAEYYEKLLRKYYLHNEDHWRGDINDAWLLEGKRFNLNDVALSVRAHRGMPGFKEHMDRYGAQSITMAWERDSKWSLVAENLAVIARNLDVAVKFGRQWQADHPKDLLVFKTLYGARTEGTAIFSSKGTKQKGVSSASQIERKFGRVSSQPIVIQLYKEPDNLEQVGVKFFGDDQTIIRSVDHIGSLTPGERVLPGMERHFPVLFRSFVIYLPREKKLVHAGGMWQATDGRIVHGGAHSVAGPLYIDRLMGHPEAARTEALKAAEKLITQ